MISVLLFAGGVISGILLSLLWGSMVLVRQQREQLAAYDAFARGVADAMTGAKAQEKPLKNAWVSSGSDRPN